MRWPGMRFGFLVAQPQLIAQFVKVKDSYNVDSLAIAGATAAIDDQAWLVANRAKIVKTRGRLQDGMRKLGFRRSNRKLTLYGTRTPACLCGPCVREAEGRADSGAIHGLCRLGGRLANFRGHRRPDRRLPDPVGESNLTAMARSVTIQRKTAETDIELDARSRRRRQVADRHGRRLLRPHADAVGQARRDRPGGQRQRRFARRPAPHGRRRRHLPGPGDQAGAGRQGGHPPLRPLHAADGRNAGHQCAST